jgi:glycosyltransferase involved in cell wall biosynthesis
LRDLAKSLKLDDRRLIGLGYISDERYFAILKGCHALVMPTLAEGGGSFPVGEALRLRIPVLCSDIPVMREAMDVIGVAPLWFDPVSPADLARSLEVLLTQRDAIQADLQNGGLTWNRSWAQVAEDYCKLFADVACRPQPTAPGERPEAKPY